MKGAPRKPKATEGVGALIRAYRAVNDLDLRAFAQLVGLSAPTIMRIEEGRSMDADTWLQLQKWMLR